MGSFLKDHFECLDGGARKVNGLFGQSKRDLSLMIGSFGNTYNCLTRFEDLIRNYGDPSILEGPKTKRILEKTRFVAPLTTTAAVGVNLLDIQRKALVYSVITHHAEEIQQVHTLNLSCDVSQKCIRGTVTSTTGQSILDGAQAPDGSPSSKKYWILRLNKPFKANVHKGPNSTIKEVSEIAFESEHWPSGQELDWSAYEGKELKIPNADKLEFWERQDTAMPIGYPRVKGLSDAKPEDAIMNLNVVLN